MFEGNIREGNIREAIENVLSEKLYITSDNK